jgi:AP-2 complex subunit alpha
MDDEDLVSAVLLLFIMTDRIQGVVLCVMSLIMAMAQDNLPAFSACYQKAVDRLYRVSKDSL